MHLNKLIIFVLSLCALASCKSPGGLFSNYQPADSTNVPVDLYRDVLSADTTSFGNMPWREVFTDPLLQQLIEKALAENTDIRKAELTIKQAEAGLMTSRLAFLPQIAFAPQGTISSFDFSKATKAYTLPIQASWQIDLFGTLRNAKLLYKLAHLVVGEYLLQLLVGHLLRVVLQFQKPLYTLFFGHHIAFEFE